MTAPDSPSPHLNRWALASLAAAILAIVAVCGGIAPIPLTGFVCFPSAIMFGLLALVSGLWSLRRIRLTAARGRELALIGTSVGALALVGVLCFLALGIWLYPSIADLAHRLGL